MQAATAWHPPFYDLMAEGAPPSTEIRTEVVLSQQPRRADLIHELEGYDDLIERLVSTLTLEERLAGLRPEERLAGLRPEERLAGLRPEEMLQFLRHLQERAEVEGNLPAAVLEALRKAVDGTP